MLTPQYPKAKYSSQGISLRHKDNKKGMGRQFISFLMKADFEME